MLNILKISVETLIKLNIKKNDENMMLKNKNFMNIYMKI